MPETGDRPMLCMMIFCRRSGTRHRIGLSNDIEAMVIGKLADLSRPREKIVKRVEDGGVEEKEPDFKAAIIDQRTEVEVPVGRGCSHPNI